MKRLYYIFGLSALLLSSCNYFEYDNYEAPNSGLKGLLSTVRPTSLCRQKRQIAIKSNIMS